MPNTGLEVNSDNWFASRFAQLNSWPPGWRVEPGHTSRASQGLGPHVVGDEKRAPRVRRKEINPPDPSPT